MKFLDRLRFLIGYKESQARIVSTLQQIGIPQSSPANYESFARNGYSKNVLGYRCVSLIARSCSGIELCLYQKSRGGELTEIEEHPLLTLLDRPNPMQSRSTFVESWFGFYGISGNSYIEAVKPRPSLPPMELWPVRPDRMKIIPGQGGYPAAYEFTAGGLSKRWPVDFVRMVSDILHVKTFNPLNDWYGLSPFEAAMLSLDQNNAAQTWNYALLKNSATPSGVLQMRVSDANPRGDITTEQYGRLKQEFYNSHMGAANAGKPLILEGGLEWKQISLTPKDMEFIKGKEVTSLDIAMAYGIPPELLGLGQKTFNNYREARLAFYEETVLPLMDLFLGELNRWLTPAFGDGLVLKYDEDDIEALTYKREQKFATIKDANFLTQNEKREAVGYEPIEGWDVFVVGSQIVSDPTQSMASDTQPPIDETQDNSTNSGTDSGGSGTVGAQTAAGSENDLNSEDSGDAEKSFKAINLLNRNEKLQSWRRQNARRKRLIQSFERDIASDLKEMNRDIVKAANVSKDPKLLEYAMIHAASEHQKTIQATLKRHIKYAVTEFGDVILEGAKSLKGYRETKANLKFQSFVQHYVETRSAQAIKEIAGTTNKKIRQVIPDLISQAIEDGDTNAELADAILEKFDGLTPARARTIARTEVANASNQGSLEAVKSLQIPGAQKEWVSAEDDRVRGNEPDHTPDEPDHASVNGQKVPIDEKFNVPPDSAMDAPGDSSAPAGQLINCRCVLVYSVSDNE